MTMHFEVAQPIQEDAELLRLWRNNPESLRMSFSYQNPLTLEQFFPEFIQKYFSIPSLPPLFGTIDGKRIGLLRFDPCFLEGYQNSCEISIVVSPEERKRGFGALMIEAALPFLKRQGVEGVLARIKEENVASLKIFAKAGYEIVERGSVFHLVKRLLPKTAKEVFIIAEAGSNWYARGGTKSKERGFQLIDAAKEAGASAIKFQTFRASETYVQNAGKSRYLKEDVYSLFKELEMPHELLFAFIEHAKKVGIEFLSSVFSPEDFALLDPYVKRHKIASYEISYGELIKLAALSKKPLILSTGASDVSDIDWAYKTFHEWGGHHLTLLQCTAKYPADPADMNLNVIPWLKSRYQVQSGLSDHSLHPLNAPLAAVALGADCIEKHFTLDRTLAGPDHAFAIEPRELKQLVEAVRSVELMRGSAFKKVLPSEEELYFFARRGIQALQDIHPGEILKLGVNIAVLRPGARSLGVHPKHLAEVEGKKIKQTVLKGEGIQLIYLESKSCKPY